MKLKLLVMDVDGTLTDGAMYMTDSGEQMKAFNAKDGLGLASLLPAMGITPVIITGRGGACLHKRCEQLGITEIYENVSDKGAVLDELLMRMNLTPDAVASIGDDVNDLPLFQRSAVSACPCDAVEAVKPRVTYVLPVAGGKGAVRAFIECLRDNHCDN